MRSMTMRRLTLLAAMAPVLAAPAARAEYFSDRPAAIVSFPLIEVDDIEATLGVVDTLIQLTNIDQANPVNLFCFYQNANSHCTNTGLVCAEASDCCVDGTCGICQPGWNETDFRIRLTPRQPIGFLASTGLETLPIDGRTRVGINGTSNVGTAIPPVPEVPFVGSLLCLVVDESGVPTDSNVVIGQATIEYDGVDASLDVAKYSAIGVRAIPGAVNGDDVLTLGGPGAEYLGCPNVLILDHFFDFAVDPVSGDSITTELTLVPCTEDFLRQIPGSTVVQFLVFNEFEQRFSTSITVDCQKVIELSRIDTTQRPRSIFHAGVSGTLTGQTRLTGIHGGLLAVAVEEHGPGDMQSPGAGIESAAFNLHYQGERESSDLITLP